MRKRGIDQGAFAKLVVEKILRTVDFGELAVKMSTAATNIGKQEVLNSLMSECPQLRLRKQRFGWDPYVISRANKLQQKILKREHEFALLAEITKQEVHLTLEQLTDISTNYDEDLDDVVEEVPETYLCEDKDVPLLCLENTTSAANPTSHQLSDWSLTIFFKCSPIQLL